MQTDDGGDRHARLRSDPRLAVSVNVNSGIDAQLGGTYVADTQRLLGAGADDEEARRRDVADDQRRRHARPRRRGDRRPDPLLLLPRRIGRRSPIAGGPDASALVLTDARDHPRRPQPRRADDDDAARQARSSSSTPASRPSCRRRSTTASCPTSWPRARAASSAPSARRRRCSRPNGRSASSSASSTARALGEAFLDLAARVPRRTTATRSGCSTPSTATATRGSSRHSSSGENGRHERRAESPHPGSRRLSRARVRRRLHRRQRPALRASQRSGLPARLSRRRAPLQPDGHLPRRHDGDLLRHAPADLGPRHVEGARRALPADDQPADRLPRRVAARCLGAGRSGSCCGRRRSLVFMQGLVQADGVSVARVSGIFKIGPPFDDTMRQARAVAPG